MAHPKVTRKQAFRAALALAGMTQEQFAAQLGVDGPHVSRVLRQKGESQRVEQEITAFIHKHLPERADAAAVLK